MLFAKISEISGQSKSITVEQILSAPTSISSGEETIPLTTAQRTEWVLDKYIRKEAVRPQELLHAARETGDIAGTSSATGQRAVKRSEDDAAGQAQGVAADQDEEQRDRGEE
ncbi:uncharacterized protein PHACADRAFT_261536 [Phanerochaete carnosa HHB-10118-sp]|uniref:Uncharacterized protein n=1 Tax=Phanerochaete carnosa (strain HHB-10118-sp) TaxID=650164 RepID=K5USI9_PHACS|nr:uncharacterized protein PHACADRAFT_261536 [Phanerochaete carnosa HHB-10118-sp]EKM52866.1 hypothetical protein PHACADRAFT_261536 [Phanerochaete carnosa HHB-10118-sp]